MYIPKGPYHQKGTHYLDLCKRTMEEGLTHEGNETSLDHRKVWHGESQSVSSEGLEEVGGIRLALIILRNRLVIWYWPHGESIYGEATRGTAEARASSEGSEP